MSENNIQVQHFNMTFLDTALKVLKKLIKDIPFNLCTTDYLEECVVFCEQLKYHTIAQVIYTNVT